MGGRHSGFVLILFVIGGALLGSILNEVLSPILPVLRHSASAGLSPATVNLVVLTVTFGFQIKLTIGTAIGIIAGLLLYRRF